MRDENCRSVELVLQGEHFLAQRRPQRRIECRERLVEQQQARGTNQRPRQRDTLLLAERQRLRAPLLKPAKPEPLDPSLGQRRIGAERKS